MVFLHIFFSITGFFICTIVSIFLWERVFNEETGKASYVLVAVETEKTCKKASVAKKAVNKLGIESRYCHNPGTAFSLYVFLFCLIATS